MNSSRSFKEEIETHMVYAKKRLLIQLLDKLGFKFVYYDDAGKDFDYFRIVDKKSKKKVKCQILYNYKKDCVNFSKFFSYEDLYEWLFQKIDSFAINCNGKDISMKNPCKGSGSVAEALVNIDLSDWRGFQI